MKTLAILIIPIFIFFISCNNSSNTTEEILEEDLSYDDTEFDESEDDTFVEENSDEMDEEKVLKFNVLYDIPEHWTMLSENEAGETIIFEPCDVQNPSVSVQLPNYERNEYKLYVGIGQDAVVLTIDKIISSSSEHITMQSEEGGEIKFSWIDRSKGIAKWEIPEVINTDFVNDKHLGDYPVEKEECDEMW